MNRRVLGGSFAACLALGLASGCGGTGGASGDVSCIGTIDGSMVCVTLMGLPATSATGNTEACLAAGLTETSSCPIGPTANESGCCENVPELIGTGKYTADYCYYSTAPSDDAFLMSECARYGGTWSD
jgi:hypothetical protein